MFPWFFSVLELILKSTQNSCYTARSTRSPPQSKFLNFLQGIALRRHLNVIKMLPSKDKIQPRFSDSILGYIFQNIPLSIASSSSLFNVFSYKLPTFTQKKERALSGNLQSSKLSWIPSSPLSVVPVTLSPHHASFSLCMYNVYVKSRSLFRDIHAGQMQSVGKV